MSQAYPYTMRECIIAYLTAMGARTYTQIQNEVRPQCSDYERNALPCLIAQLTLTEEIGTDGKRFAVSTVDLINAETRDRRLMEQRLRDAETANEKLFGPIPKRRLDDLDESE